MGLKAWSKNASDVVARRMGRGVLLTRKLHRSMPSSMADRKTALVLEGGGMRSSYLAGVLIALHERRIHFDAVIGTSAGACCGASFIIGEPENNKIILEDHLTSGYFVRYGNIFNGGNLVDIDYLIDDVCMKHVPLDLERVKNSPTLLYMAATDYQTGEVFYFNNREHDIREALRASCAMPYLYRKKVVINGRRYIDGGVVADIPLDQALALGYTDIVVVSTRYLGFRKTESWISTQLSRWIYSDSPVLTQVFKNRHVVYNRALDLIETPPEGCRIHLIASSKPLPVTRTTRAKKKVREAVNLGYEDGIAFDRGRGNS